MNDVELIADSVTFFHLADELMFFQWLARMKFVVGYEGRGVNLHIRLARRPDDDELRELLAFHHRYGIAMRQLAQFLTPDNAAWFDDPIKYWHKQVFALDKR